MGEWMDTQQGLIIWVLPCIGGDGPWIRKRGRILFSFTLRPDLVGRSMPFVPFGNVSRRNDPTVAPGTSFLCAGRPEEDGEVLAMQPSLVLVGAGLGGDAREQQG